MGHLDRLRAWWRRKIASPDPDATAEAGSVSEYECAVCGTSVEGPDGECPLCRSTDVVPAGGSDGEGDRDDPPSGGRRHVSAGDDASVERLRDLRGDDEVLRRYADRWEQVDGGLRVETSDGTRVVDSREEAAALLRAEDDRR
jgi:hypothetical protein